MLDFTNTQDLTLDERKLILQRALNSQPYFEALPFTVVVGTRRDRQYEAKLRVDKDFWITDVKGNFNDVFIDTTSEFWLSIWESYNGESIHKFIRSEYLPPSFQCYDTRFDAAFASQIYADTQHEILPYLLKRGNSVMGSIDNRSAKTQAAEALVVLAGYFTLNNTYISPRLQQGINESLADEPIFELHRFRVTANGIINNQLSNDRYARLVLGFGVVDLSTPKANLAESTIQITDNVRGLKLNNTPIPIQYIAPRLTALRDKHIDFLPVEYLFEPFATLRFETNTILHDGGGYEFVMLTRTV